MTETSIKRTLRKTSLIVASCAGLAALAGCGGVSSEAEAARFVPDSIRIVDETLAQPFDAHFRNIQGDYAVADRIADDIQRVIDEVPLRSKFELMLLIEEAETLVRRPEEDEYRSLVAEWQRVRPAIGLKE